MSDATAANVEFHWGVRIPLRDGVHLSATVYTPRNQVAPMPCILLMTPYIADTFHTPAARFASHGLPCVVVDVRGRGNSDGVFNPSIQEAQDGYDVIEWLARQTYCNGKVGMYGGSYLGYAQWAAAKEFPPHLCTIVPVAAPFRGVDGPMRNNIFSPERVQWIVFTSGRAAQVRMYQDDAFWSAVFRRWYESGRPFRDVDVTLGTRLPVFQEWLSHPEPDEYWDAQNPAPEHYARLKIPVLSMTGVYDDDQPGALEHYRQHMRYGSAESRARHFLVIGPWDHSRIVVPSLEFGGLRVGPASLLDITKLHREWYAWTMQEGPRPGFLKKNVAYYVMGAECWRYADTLDEATAQHMTYHLSSNGSANDVSSSGSLDTSCGSGPPDSYTYDPRDTRGPEVEMEAQTPRNALTDQRVVLALSGRHLIYRTGPFTADTEITGFFKLSAWIAIDCQDTDIYVSVHEIDANGGSLRLSTDAMRARYREGLRSPRLIQTRDPLRYDFERFTFVSRVIKRGHRLRLVVSPVGRLIETVFSQKNFNGGGVVAEESAMEGRPVTVHLYHDETHRSVLSVPLGRGAHTDAREES